MIAHWELKQGTEEWFAIRWGKIGGTTSKGLFVKSDTLLDELLSEITEPFEMEDSFESADMIRGYELEPLARQELSAYTGIDLKECGWLQCEEIPLLGISPDGLSEDMKVSAETKCPARKRHMTTIRTNEIPLDNLHQCVHYFTVNPYLEKHYFASFRPESIKPLFVKLLTRDSEVNLGTKAKPVIKTISEWVSLAKTEAVNIQTDIDNSIAKLNAI